MGMATPLYYSADQVRELPEDGNRYEVVDGELLVTPSPRPWHQIVTGRLFRALADYLDRHPVGHVIASPADISWSPLDLVQPDLFVVPLEAARTLNWAAMRHLLLVAEVLSPATARADRFTKRRLYQRSGVPLYWIVDADRRAVEIWTPEWELPEQAADLLVWQPDPSAPPFALRLAELFRPL